MGLAACVEGVLACMRSARPAEEPGNNQTAGDRDHANHQTDERGLSVGKGSARGRDRCRAGGRRSQHRNNLREAADEHREAERVVQNGRWRKPGEGAAVVPIADV
jgi:hypothetical protein